MGWLWSTHKGSEKCLLYCHAHGLPIEVFSIGNHRFYSTLWHTTRNYTAQITITLWLLFFVTVLTALFGNGFQHWVFFCSLADILASWRPYRTNLLPSKCRIRTLSTVTPLLRFTQPLPSNGYFSGCQQICNNILIEKSVESISEI
jgi:hypothetical protein